MSEENAPTVENIKIVISQGDEVLSEFTCVRDVTEAFFRGEDIHGWFGGYDSEINACCRGRVIVQRGDK